MKVIALCSVLLLGLVAISSADPKPKRIEITVTAKGFEPDRIQVPASQPVMLVITRTTDRTCAKSVVIQLGDGKKVEKTLPLDTAVEVPVTFAKKGELAYACSMDMIKGVILVQ